MNKKIIFVITRGDTIGGAQTHLILLCKHLQTKNIDIKVIVGGANTILRNKLKSINIDTYEINHMKREISAMNDLLALFLLIKIFIREKPNLISAHSSKAGILSRLASFILKIPIVFTVHGWAFTEGVEENKRKLYINIEKFLAKITNKIIAVSDYDYQLAIKENVCNRDKIIMIHNGIDFTDYTKLKKESNILNLVMVARFDKPKDQLKLIKSVQNINGIKLHLIGDGPKVSDCISYVQLNNLNEKIVFLGYSDNVKSYLLDMDIFILISNYEGFPISTLEAMSVGLPIIISDVGGASESIINGDNGFAVQNDVESIAAAIIKLKNNDNLRDLMGLNSLKIVKEKFSSLKMTNETFDVFKSYF